VVAALPLPYLRLCLHAGPPQRAVQRVQHADDAVVLGEYLVVAVMVSTATDIYVMNNN
jgi:hypothetical protein